MSFERLGGQQDLRLDATLVGGCYGVIHLSDGGGDDSQFSGTNKCFRRQHAFFHYKLDLRIGNDAAITCTCQMSLGSKTTHIR